MRIGERVLIQGGKIGIIIGEDDLGLIEVVYQEREKFSEHELVSADKLQKERE